MRIAIAAKFGVLIFLWAGVLFGGPHIVAHRGASGYRPEHTLAAYTMGLKRNADFIEVDLISTKDGVLICRHDCELGSTTDVADKFPDRKRTITIDGKRHFGFFAQDFYWEEIKQLRIRERNPFRSNRFDGKFSIPTFEEVLQLVEQHNQFQKKRVGVCPELKHPAYHRRQALPLEERLLGLLNRYGYSSSQDRCVIQSFDPDCLRHLKKQTDLRLLQLLPQEKKEDVVSSMFTNAGLAKIATYATLIGVPKASLFHTSERCADRKPTGLIHRARQHGLKVWVYTFREIPQSIWYAPTFAQEVRQVADLQPDGLITDFPDLVRRILQTERRP